MSSHHEPRVLKPILRVIPHLVVSAFCTSFCASFCTAHPDFRNVAHSPL